MINQIHSSLLYQKFRIRSHFPDFSTGNWPYVLLASNRVQKKLFPFYERAPEKNRRVIFVLSSGRAGSGFLANLLQSSMDVVAKHEPRPQMIGRFLYDALDEPSSSFLARHIKLLGINHCLRRHPDKRYAETSHMFIKSYHDVICNYYTNADFIVLRRDLVSVIKSFMQLGYFSANNRYATLWMHKCNRQRCLIEPIDKYERMDQFERIIAYLLDIEARMQHFEKKRAERCHSVYLEQITQEDGAKQLFNSLQISWTDTSSEVFQQVKNQRESRKDYFSYQTTLAECKDRLLQYLEIASERGIQIPNLNNLF